MATNAAYALLSNDQLDRQIQELKKRGARGTPVDQQDVQGGADMNPVEETGAPSVAGGLMSSDYVSPEGRRGLTLPQTKAQRDYDLSQTEKRSIEADAKIRNEYWDSMAKTEEEFNKSSAAIGKRGIEDKRARDIQEIEGKIRGIEGQPTYQMPRTEKEIAGTGIYEGPTGISKVRPGEPVRSFSNQGVTSVVKALTPGQEEEVKDLQERRKDIEAGQLGKVREPKAEKLSDFDKFQERQSFARIGKINSMIDAANNGKVSIETMIEHLEEINPGITTEGMLGSKNPNQKAAIKNAYIRDLTQRSNEASQEWQSMYGKGRRTTNVAEGLTAAPAKTAAAPGAGGQGTPVPAKPAVETPTLAVGQNIGGRIIESIGTEQDTGEQVVKFKDGTAVYAKTIAGAAQGKPTVKPAIPEISLFDAIKQSEMLGKLRGGPTLEEQFGSIGTSRNKRKD